MIKKLAYYLGFIALSSIAWAAVTVDGVGYDFIFRGTENNQWNTIGNWYTGSADNWTMETGLTPGSTGSNKWAPALLDGDLMPSIAVDGSYKMITAPQLEGWASKIGAYHGVHVTINGFIKLQGGCAWHVDKTSKITVTNGINGGGNTGGDTNLYVASPDGVTFGADFNKEANFKYYLDAQGSVAFKSTGSATHELKTLMFEVSSTKKVVTQRRIIAYTSATAPTFTNATIMAETTAGITVSTHAKTEAVTVEDEVGTYRLYVVANTDDTSKNGLYVEYVDYVEPFYSTTLTTENVSWSDLAWTLNGESVASLPTNAMLAEITVPTTGATLTMNANVSLQNVQFKGGALKIVYTNEHMPVITNWNFSGVTSATVEMGGIVGKVTPPTGGTVVVEIPTETTFVAGYTPILTTIGSTVSAFSVSPALSAGQSLTIINGQLYVQLATVSATFTPSVAADWADRTLPTSAKPDFVTATSGASSYVQNSAYDQTLEAKTATVVTLEGATTTTPDVFALGFQPTDATFTKDIYLKVSEGNYGIVTGGQEAHWQSNKRVQLTGNILTEMAGGTAKNVLGAGYKAGTLPTVTGNTGVTIEGDAIVKGSIVGGWTSAHNSTGAVTGNTSVLVKNVQGTTDTAATLVEMPAGWIVGAGARIANSESKTTVGGNSSVTIDLPVSATGTFVKNIVGGGWANGGGKQAVNGTATVAISAPATVTFSGNIYGGGYASGGSATVAGAATVALKGGTYTGSLQGGNTSADAVVTLTSTEANKTVLNGATLSNVDALAVVGEVELQNSVTFNATSLLPILSTTGGFKAMTSATLTGTADLLLDAGQTLKLAAAEDQTLTVALPIFGEGTVQTEGTVVGPETLTIGTSRPTTIHVLSGTTTITFTETISDGGVIPLNLVLADGVTMPTVTVFRADGTTAITYTIKDGNMTFDPAVSGKICWYDFEFNGNQTNVGSASSGFGGTDNTPVYDETQQCMYIRACPWMNITYPTEWSASLFTTLPQNKNNVVVAFGTKTGGFVGLIKGEGDTALLVRTTGDSAYAVLATMTVPNATTARHLYSFIKRARSIEIYLDANLWLTYTSETDITFGSGFQMASVHGDLGSTGVTRPADDDPALIDMLRIYNVALTPTHITALANEFTYVSPNGSFARTINETTADWVSDNTWTKAGTEEKSSLPAANSAISVTAATETTVTLNLDADTTAEALTLDGDSSIKLGAAESPHTLTVEGLLNIATDATLDIQAVVLAGPVKVGEGKTLTFDVTCLSTSLTPFSGSFTKTLAGLITLGEGAKIECLHSDLPAGATMVIEKDATTGCYELRYTASGLTATVTGSEVVWTATATGDATTLPTSGSIEVPVEVKGSGTLTLPTGLTFSAVTLDSEASITFADSEGTTITTLVAVADMTLNSTQTLIKSVSIAADKTVTVDATTDSTLSTAITGEGKFAKTGAGVLTLNATVASNGGSTVVEGTLKFTSNGSIGIAGGTSISEYYTASGDVRVKTGATLDFDGTPDVWTRMITLEEGAKLVNTGAEIGSATRQFQGLTLEGDATIENANNFGLLASAYGNTTLTLNGYTLTKQGAGKFWLVNTTVDNGTLKVVSDTATTNGFYVEQKTQGNSLEGNSEFANGVTFDADFDTAFEFVGTQICTGSLTKAGVGALTFPGVISGTGDLTVNAGTLTLSAANTATGTISFAENGNGTLVLTGTNTWDPTFTLPAGATLDLSNTSARLFATGDEGFIGNVTICGTLKIWGWQWGEALGNLNHNTAHMTLDGGTVAFTATNTAARGFTVSAKGATFDIAAGNTYTFNNTDATNATAVLTGNLTLTGSGIFEDTATAPFTGAGQLVVSKGITLKGTATLGCAVEFKAGATIDATANSETNALTVISATWPTGLDDAVTVNMVETPAEGTLILKTTVAATKEGVDALVLFLGNAHESSTTMFAFMEGNNYVAKTVKTPTNIPTGTSENAKEALREIMADSGVTEATVSGTTAGQELTADQLNGALELFGNIETVTPAVGETPAVVDISYDFGISDIKVDTEDPTQVAVTVKVQNKDAEPATIIGGNTVVLAVEGGDAVEQAISEDTDKPIVLKLPIEKINGKKLTVKVQSGIIND